MRSLSSSTTMTMNGKPLVALPPRAVGLVRGRELAAIEHRVVAGDVADADLGQHLVAHLHLAHGPRQGVRGLLGIGDDGREQVRDVVVRTELDPLRVDEDEAHLVGRVAHQQRRDERVDAARLAGARGAGDEHVRQLGDVEHDGTARDVAPEANLERGRRRLRFRRHEDVAERHELALPVRHLHADRGATGNRGEDANIGRRHRVRDVVGEPGHAVDLDAGCELELVAGHRRPDGHADELRVDAVLVQRGFEDLAAFFDHAAIGFVRVAALEQLRRRKLPRALALTRTEVERGLTVVFDDDGWHVGQGRLFLRAARRLGIAFDVVQRDDRQRREIRFRVRAWAWARARRRAPQVACRLRRRRAARSSRAR